ncbi:MAG: hypothetical protein ACRERE_33165 [Candidatus Entotheonellia bacterium]
MVALHDQVLNLVRQRQHWDQRYRHVKFKDEYKQWFGYERMRVLNILGMYRWVTNHRRGVWESLRNLMMRSPNPYEIL